MVEYPPYGGGRIRVRVPSSAIMIHEHCGHSIEYLSMMPGPPYSVHCSKCKGPIAEGVYQCLEKILSRAQDIERDYKEEIRALHDKIEDLRWRIQMGRDLGRD